MWMFVNWYSASTKYLVEEASNRWYSIDFVDKNQNLLYITDSNWKKKLFKNIDGWNSTLWFKLTYNKDLTYSMFEYNNIIYPKSLWLNKSEDIDINEIRKIWYPLVVKPADTDHGIWIVCGINNDDELVKWINYAFEFSNKIIIQKELKWFDHRIIVIWGEVTCGIKRMPANVIWDGKNSIKELIEIENQNPLRWSDNYDSSLVKIQIDYVVETYLKSNYNYNINSIPAKDEQVYLRWNANTWTWWTVDPILPDTIHEETKKLCKKIAEIFELNIVWIDIITENISEKITTWWVIELNATPWIFSFNQPIFTDRWINVAWKILDMYFK